MMRELVSIVLASASPRRYELLTSLGLNVSVVPSGIVEGDRPGHTPVSLAVSYAAAKADSVFERSEPEAIVIAADTVVNVDGCALGKPADAATARGMLRRLAGREHVVHTAYSIRTSGGGLDGCSTTRVCFAPRDDAAIEAYVASGEPFDKAGAYGVQGRGAALVERVDGDFYTVMGFPLGDFIRRLPELGLCLGSARRVPETANI